eukprot:11771-Heterococcus_DN1.PRE.1
MFAPLDTQQTSIDCCSSCSGGFSSSSSSSSDFCTATAHTCAVALAVAAVRQHSYRTVDSCASSYSTVT